MDVVHTLFEDTSVVSNFESHGEPADYSVLRSEFVGRVVGGTFFDSPAQGVVAIVRPALLLLQLTSPRTCVVFDATFAQDR